MTFSPRALKAARLRQRTARKTPWSVDYACSQLAVRTGHYITPMTLRNWEAGKHTPNLMDLVALSTVYQVSMESLWGRPCASR